MSNFTPAQLPAFSGSVDGAQDLTIWWSHANSTLTGITRNQMLNVASQPVGISDSQTLTNKTITSPTISGPTLSGTVGGTYTIGGTPTFPASVVTLTGSQTLTNKTITSPAITGGTLDNATVTVDTVAGHTTSNTGTIYGMSVTAGLLASTAIAGQVVTASLASGIEPATVAKNPYNFSVYRNSALSISTLAKVTFDTASWDTGSNFDVATNHRFTAPAAGFYLLYFSLQVNNGSTAVTFTVYLYVNGSAVMEYDSPGTTGTANTSISATKMFKLSVNDYVELYAYCSTSSGMEVGSGRNYFGGHLVSAT